VTVRAVLLDLDDTLVPDYADFLAAVDDTSAALGAPPGMGAAVHARARARWRRAVEAAVLRESDLSSWEALWAPFPAEVGAWAREFRAASWREALADHGVDDSDLAGRLADSYRARRMARCLPYPDVVPALDGLRGRVRLAVVTNGIDGHQRAKLAAAGLTGRFDVVVASSAVGASKPDPRIFRAALARLGLPAADAVMIGDNPLRDVAGAQAAGLRGVWVDRTGGDDHGVAADARVEDLGGLEALGWW
jgi:phosphoserine phosphatase